MAVYVDTSVLVAYYVPEPLSDQVEDLRLLTADRHLAEVAEELSVEHVLVSE